MPLWLYISKPCPCWSHLEALESGPRKSGEMMNAKVTNVAQCSICMSFKKIAGSSSFVPEKKDARS